MKAVADAPDAYYIVAETGLDPETRALKDGETFAVFDVFGDIGASGAGQGLYHDGTRHLSLCQLRLTGHRPFLLGSSTGSGGHVLTVHLTRRVRGWVPNIPIIARARDTAHAAELYKAGATDAVPETLESSLQLSEALLVDLGIAVGPVIASIHEERDKMRKAIKEAADLHREPRLRRTRKAEDATAG